MSFLEMAKVVLRKGKEQAPIFNGDQHALIPVAIDDAARALRSATPTITPDDLPADWHEAWAERAAIMQYDGKMPPEQADSCALLDIIRRMHVAGVTVERQQGATNSAPSR